MVLTASALSSGLPLLSASFRNRLMHMMASSGLVRE